MSRCKFHLTRNRHGVPTSTAVAAVTLDKLLELQSNFAFLVLGAAVLLRDGLFEGHLNSAALLVMVGPLSCPPPLLALWCGQANCRAFQAADIGFPAG